MKRIKEIIPISSIMIALALSSTPCNALSSLRITDSDDNTSIFKVDENLCLEVRGDILSLTAPDVGNEFQIKDLKEFNYISDMSTTVEIISSEDATAEVHLTSDMISLVTHSESPQFYSIFNASGALIERKCFNKETNIPLSSFSSGGYILTVNNLPSLKFIVK